MPSWKVVPCLVLLDEDEEFVHSIHFSRGEALVYSDHMLKSAGKKGNPSRKSLESLKEQVLKIQGIPETAKISAMDLIRGATEYGRETTIDDFMNRLR